MQRSTYILFVFCTLSWVGGCSDLGSTVCDKGEVSVDGACMKPDIDDRFADPPSRTKTLTLACTNDQTPDPSAAGWELTVDPGPIVGGEAFGAVFGGTLVVDESLLDESLALVPSGYTRVRIHDLRATVHVRSGIASANADVALRNQPIQTTCAYDKRGRDGPLADPQFPPCSTAKDDENGSGSNADCTGLGGVPDPRNPCGQFVSLPFSTDCELCANEGKAAQCADLGFCITDNFEDRPSRRGGWLLCERLGKCSLWLGRPEHRRDSRRNRARRAVDLVSRGLRQACGVKRISDHDRQRGRRSL